MSTTTTAPTLLDTLARAETSLHLQGIDNEHRAVTRVDARATTTFVVDVWADLMTLTITVDGIGNISETCTVWDQDTSNYETTLSVTPPAGVEAYLAELAEWVADRAPEWEASRSRQFGHL